ncbi:MAG: penicillin-binding protein [Bdellovibrionales bacterium]|nr:penicillin-binding protein [Bdellovibrionales bacterium]
MPTRKLARAGKRSWKRFKARTIDTFDPKAFKRLTLPAAGLTVAALAWLTWSVLQPGPGIEKSDLGDSLADHVARGQFPERLKLPLPGRDKPVKARLRYSLHPEYQRHVRKVLEAHRPDYASFVAIDPATGQVLSLVNSVHGEQSRGLASNLAVQARFPAASVFKVITAAAAIDQRRVSADTVIPYNGGNHTLYRRNVTSDASNRWTRYVSVRDAFARSINTVFGKLGAYYLGRELIEDYAHRFGFNREIPSDFPFAPGESAMDEEQPWSVVEAASGFTRTTTLSPVHGALIAASIVNEGVMMEPYLVESVSDAKTGEELYRALPRVASVTVDPVTASELRELMQATVKRGTTRDTFRSFFRRKQNQDVEVGGKTGSLTGTDVRGRTDWFIGYATVNGRSVAFASLTVHEHLWRVKSAQVARAFVELFALEARQERVVLGSNAP